jgi:hypothetical protein
MVNLMSDLKIIKIKIKETYNKMIDVYFEVDGFEKNIPIGLDVILYKKYKKMRFSEKEKVNLDMIYDFIKKNNPELLI